MSAPFYVSPEQWYQDKAEYARKGIARGRPIVALDFEDGVVVLAENRSSGLRKVAEIYDRIAFAAVGKFDEYENLRKAGIRYADLRGFSFSREDVAAANLANEYSTLLGNIFTREMKPFEVEILVCEISDGETCYFQILFDGFISDHRRFATIGGEPDDLRRVLRDGWKENLQLSDAVKLGRTALEGAADGDPSSLDESSLEIAILDQKRDGRKFRRLAVSEVHDLLGG